MRAARHLVVALSFVVAAAAGCHRDPCLSLCERNAKELGCHHPEDCKSSCKKLHESPVCGTPLKEFESCFLKEPREHWECDDFDGVPALKDGVCGAERGRVLACLQSQPLLPQVPAKP